MPVATVTIECSSDWTTLQIIDGAKWGLFESGAKIVVNGRARATDISEKLIGNSSTPQQALGLTLIVQVDTGAAQFFSFVCRKGAMGTTKITTLVDERINANSTSPTNDAQFTIFVAKRAFNEAMNQMDPAAGEFTEMGRYGKLLPATLPPLL